MYIGHFAIGLALKATNPKINTLPILIGIGLLDILDGILLFIGIDKATPNAGAGPYLFFDLNFVDWDHSFLMALFWAIVWGLLFIKNKTTAWLMAFAVFSHYLADLLVHNHDMALYPYSTAHSGLGLWGKWGIWSWIAEGIFATILLIYASLKVSRFYMSLIWPAVILLLQFVLVSPWLSPMKLIGKLAMPQAQKIFGLVLIFSFIGPSLLFSWLWKKAENKGA